MFWCRARTQSTAGQMGRQLLALDVSAAKWANNEEGVECLGDKPRRGGDSSGRRKLPTLRAGSGLS